MSKPAARLMDMHVCPMVTPGTPPVPHVGGPITGPGCPTVLIGNMPAATVGDMCTCVGPPDTIAMGSTGVLIGGKPAARMGDSTAHGGIISVGCPTVLIGETSGGGGGGGAGNSSGGSADENESTSDLQNKTLEESFDQNPKYSDGLLGEMNPINVLPLLSAFQNSAKKGKAFCEVCQKSEDALNAEQKAVTDSNNSMLNRNLDQERNLRKNAAENGSMLMENKCMMTDTEKDAVESQLEKKMSVSPKSIKMLQGQLAEASKTGKPFCSVCER